MRQLDVVLSVLTLVAIGMGVAAYRAWHPDQAASEPVSDTPRVQSPQPADVTRTEPLRHGPHPTVVGRVECRNGLLYWQADQGVKPVEAVHNFPDAARCEIQAEPVRPDNSTANE